MYIAGPYTKGDVVLNVRKAIWAAEVLASNGFLPFIPHLFITWHMISPHKIDFWYELDLEFLAHCDVILKLPGESIGADKEVASAKDKTVYYDVDKLITEER